MTQPEHPWPLVDVALVTADWDDGLDIATHAAEAQRLSDWQRAWMQAAAELDYTIPWQDPDTTEEAGRLWALVAKWEQRAKEQQQ